MMISSRSMLTGLATMALAAGGALPACGQVGRVAGAQFAVAAAVNNDNGSGTDSTSIPGLDHEAEAILPHSAEADDRLARADAHFSSGRQYYFQGNIEAARREFNAAVDTLLNAPDSIPDHRRLELRLDEICDLIYRFDIEKLGSGQTQEDAVVFDKAPIDEISHMTFPVDENLAPRLKTELNQTSSGIPLELAEPVVNYVHYFQTDRGRKILLAGFRRSGRYKSLIERVFTEEGVPQELIYLAQAESGFLPRAVSRKNAVGMWQFIAGTGDIYQLGRAGAYDERLDPEKATRAAARYLKNLYARYNDWYLAMAAYNCGAGAVDRAVERTGYADYWELLKRHALPRETSSYVPIIVAMTIIAKNPQDYGLDKIDVDPAVEYENVRLTAPTSIDLVADAAMQPVSVIRDLNPSLLRNVVPVGFQVHVPKGSADSTEAALDTVPAVNRQAWRLHHVLAGDTLATIAKSYHLAPDRIVSVNRAADSIEAGDVLLIPAVYHPDSKPLQLRHGARGKASLASAHRSSGARVQRSAHISASRRVSPPVLHRKAAVRSASLTQ